MRGLIVLFQDFRTKLAAARNRRKQHIAHNFLKREIVTISNFFKHPSGYFIYGFEELFVLRLKKPQGVSERERGVEIGDGPAKRFRGYEDTGFEQPVS
jgi:hypothetical protein